MIRTHTLVASIHYSHIPCEVKKMGEFTEILLFSILCLLVLKSARSDKKTTETPVVKIDQGYLKGKILKTLKDQTIYAFLGIPYGKPPINNLRFQPPVPADPWKGILQATEDGAMCLQITFPQLKYNGSEDCLFINVYTKELADDEEEVKKPVMVFFHPDGFTFGSSSSTEYGPQRLLDSDIVLVTLNYRLGPLGFLSTEDEILPGNYGLKDQVLALKWVQKNIATFGGDPDAVTIFGGGSGAISVHYHMLSPMSEGLFHRAISQGGTALTPWALNKNARETAFKLGRRLGCKDDSSEDLLNCLREMDEEKMVRQTVRLREWGNDLFFPFIPSIEPEGENSFITRDPLDMMKAGEMKKLPWMVGVTSNEGLQNAMLFVVVSETFAELDEDFYNVAPIYFDYERDTQKSMEISKHIREFYFRDNPINFGTLSQLEELCSDYFYFHGLSKTLNMLSSVNSSPIYVYQLSYQRTGPRFSFGVPHLHDIKYLFHNLKDLIPVSVKDPDYPIVQLLVKMWSDFASTGDPTPEKSEWQPMKSHNFEYVDITTELEMKSSFHPERMAFWDELEEFALATSPSSHDNKKPNDEL